MAKRKSTAMVRYRANPLARRSVRVNKSSSGVSALLVVALAALVVYLLLRNKEQGMGGETWKIHWNEGAMLPEEKAFRRKLQGLLEKDFSSVSKVTIRNNKRLT